MQRSVLKKVLKNVNSVFFFIVFLPNAELYDPLYKVRKLKALNCYGWVAWQMHLPTKEMKTYQKIEWV